MFIRITGENGKVLSSLTVDPRVPEGVQTAIADIEDVASRYGVTIVKVEYVYIKVKRAKKAKKPKKKKP